MGLWTTIIAPAALLVLIPAIAQLDREVFNDLRIELDAVQIDDGALSGSGVRFGGGSDDDFQIRAAPPELAELRADGEILRLTFPHEPVGDDSWVVEVATGGQFDRRSTILGSIPLSPGDGLCVSRCEVGAGSWATLVQDGSDRRLEATVQGVRGPTLIRPKIIPLFPEAWTAWVSSGLDRTYAPSRRIFPLRDILPEALCPPGSGCVLENLRSFVWDSGEGLRLVVLDPMVLIDSGGEVVQANASLPPRVLNAGDVISVWRVDFAPPGFEVSNRDDVASRLRGRTRFEIERREHGIAIGLLDAGVMELRRRDIVRELESSSNERLSIGGMGDVNAQLSFADLGGAAAGGAQGALYVPGDLLDNRAISMIEIESRRDGAFNRQHVLLDRPFPFQDAGIRPEFTLSQEKLPWPLIGLALSGWLILVLCQYRLWRSARVAWILSTGVQLLLALRFVVAIEAAYMDLNVDAAVRLQQATLAFLLGGGVMALVAPAHARKVPALIGITLVIAASLVHSWAQDAFVGLLQLLPFAAFVGAAPVVLWLDRPRKGTSGSAPIGWLEGRWWKAGAASLNWLKTSTSEVWNFTQRRVESSPWFFLLALVVVVRLLLSPFAREREGIALSAVYLPCMLLVAALVLRRALDGPQKGRMNLEWIFCLGVLMASGGALVWMVIWGPDESPIWLGYRVAVFLLAAVALATLVRFWMQTAKAGKTDRERPSIGWWGGWCFIGVLGSMGVVVPGFVRDIGFAPLILAPLGVAAWIALSQPQKQGATVLRPTWAWAAPLVFCLGLLILPRAMALDGGETAQIVAAGQAESNDAALSVLERSVGQQQNPLRILLLSDPDQARQSGTSQAESLSIWSSYLQDFGREPFGHGYLADVNLGPLAQNHQDDNLSAVHLISPYGRFGALLFLAWMGAVAAGAARVRSETEGAHRQHWSTRDLLGLFALWTPFALGAYMILANLQMIPFTGRNVYLLAAFSGSDWLEGMTLFALAQWLLGRGRTGPASARRNAP